MLCLVFLRHPVIKKSVAVSEAVNSEILGVFLCWPVCVLFLRQSLTVLFLCRQTVIRLYWCFRASYGRDNVFHFCAGNSHRNLTQKLFTVLPRWPLQRLNFVFMSTPSQRLSPDIVTVLWDFWENSEPEQPQSLSPVKFAACSVELPQPPVFPKSPICAVNLDIPEPQLIPAACGFFAAWAWAWGSCVVWAWARGYHVAWGCGFLWSSPAICQAIDGNSLLWLATWQATRVFFLSLLSSFSVQSMWWSPLASINVTQGPLFKPH